MKRSKDKEEGTKVLRLMLHQTFTVNGVTATTLYSDKGFDMEWYTDGVHCEYKGWRFIIPHANIIAAFENNPSEDAKKKEAKAQAMRLRAEAAQAALEARTNKTEEDPKPE